MNLLKTVVALSLLAIVPSIFAVDGIAIKSTYPNNDALSKSEGKDILNNDIVRLNIVSSQVSGSPVLLATNAGREHLSPDGQKVAFLKWVDDTKSKLCVMSINGGAATELCEVKPWVGIDFPNNEYIYFNGDNPERRCGDPRGSLGGEQGGEIWRININTKDKELMVTLYPEGNTSRVATNAGGDIDVSYDMRRICFRPPNTLGGITCNAPNSVDPPKPFGGYVIFDMANISGGKGILYSKNSVSCDLCTGGEGKSDNSCGGGMSYDGKWVYDGWTGHRAYDIRDASNMSTIENTINCGNEHNPGAAGGACNNADWICRTLGDGWNTILEQSLFNWRTGEQIITGKGDGGDFWVGTASTNPAMQLSPGTLLFTVDKNAANPAAKNIAVSNSGSGTLSAVTTSIAYGAGTPTGWLSVSVTGGASNSQALVNSVTIDTRDTGTYTATITVTCSNASPTTSTYSVSLRINPILLTIGSVVVSPAVCTTYTRSIIAFSALAKDAAGTALNPQPTVTWTISSPMTIGANGTFISGTVAGGPYTVTAAATVKGVTKTGTASVKVVRPITIIAPAATPVRRVGDTLVVTWIKPATIATGGLLVSFSADGRNWIQISGDNYNGTVNADGLIKDNTAFYAGTTGTFKWIIPAMVGDAGTISTISATCKIQLKDSYAVGARMIEDQSAQFAIQSKTGVINNGLARQVGGLYRVVNVAKGVSVIITSASLHTLDVAALDGSRIVHKTGTGAAEYVIERKTSPAGVYIVRITVDGKEHVGRIVIN